MTDEYDGDEGRSDGDYGGTVMVVIMVVVIVMMVVIDAWS